MPLFTDLMDPFEPVRHGDPTYPTRLAAWRAFHAAHPEVYRELVRRCDLMLARRQRFSIRTIWEAMRWDFWMANPPQPYKMNDHHTPFYSRYLMWREPRFRGLFETRSRAFENGTRGAE